MKKLSAIVLGLLAATGIFVSRAHAQYFLRGDFNGWGTTPLTDNGNGTFSATITGGTPGANVDFKIANADWSSAFPGSNARAVYDSSGSLTVNFIPNPAADGWSPGGTSRVGYNDPGQFGWEIMGSFNNWSSPVLSLTPVGNGVYSGIYDVATPGTYYFKFREAGSWNIAVGNDFGNSADNITLTTSDFDVDVDFVLDLPDGRWEVTTVPEPSALALLGFGLTALVCLRRRQ